MFLTNKVQPLQVAANDDQHQQTTNTSKDMLHMHSVHELL
jgi:hypothetical protein